MRHLRSLDATPRALFTFHPPPKMKRFILLIALPLFAQEPEGNTTARKSKAPDALTVSEFGKQGMIGSGVAITLDDRGVAYVLQTYRRNNAELDIRKNKDWLLDSLALTSPEGRQALIKKRMPDTWQSLADFKEKIIRLEDTDDDGRADKRTIVFEGLNELGSGLAAGILWHDGALYVTCMPSLWKLTDKDGDGIFETKEELVRGIGYHIGYGGHDMHGPTLGPDGRIYWTTGDKGIHVKPKDGPEVHLPGQGGCFRIEPDGSHFEVFAHGLRNSEDLAFDEFGNLFTVDNDGDFGDKERAINIVEGADYAWRMHYQYRSDRSWSETAGYNPWIIDNLWKPSEQGQYQPAYLTPALANFSVGPIGIDYNPGTALSEKWRNTFFLAESSKDIQAIRFEPQGAGFKMLEPQAVVTGPFSRACRLDLTARCMARTGARTPGHRMRMGAC
jgi:putative membrane-bound dehydrogenase-like protein